MTEHENQTGRERRQAPRYGIPGRVTLHGTEEWCGEYQTANISATGAFLISDSPPPRGTTVRLNLSIDPLCMLEDIQALVVHVRTEASTPRARGCGLMFLHLTESQRQLLLRLLAVPHAREL